MTTTAIVLTSLFWLAFGFAWGVHHMWERWPRSNGFEDKLIEEARRIKFNRQFLDGDVWTEYHAHIKLGSDDYALRLRLLEDADKRGEAS